MMMHLIPASSDFSENSAGADGKLYFFISQAEISPLSPYDVKHLRRLVDGVVVKLDVDLHRTAENKLVNGPNLGPAALDSPKWIISLPRLPTAPICILRLLKAQ